MAAGVPNESIDCYVSMEGIDLAIQALSNVKAIDEPAVSKYFSKLNNGEYTEVSELFSEQGSLYPPFEKVIYGREVIAKYLTAEAKGVVTCPEFVTVSIEECQDLCCQVEGKVKTSWFTVNASWFIRLNAEKEILMVRVKLLNELQDLLALKRVKS
jgi:Nuclear transport factor 2 (NTF2) domain